MLLTCIENYVHILLKQKKGNCLKTDSCSPHSLGKCNRIWEISLHISFFQKLQRKYTKQTMTEIKLAEVIRCSSEVTFSLVFQGHLTGE